MSNSNFLKHLLQFTSFQNVHFFSKLEVSRKKSNQESLNWSALKLTWFDYHQRKSKHSHLPIANCAALRFLISVLHKRLSLTLFCGVVGNEDEVD